LYVALSEADLSMAFCDEETLEVIYRPATRLLREVEALLLGARPVGGE